MNFSNKTKIIISLIIVVVLSLAAYLYFDMFATYSLKYYNDSEKVIYVEQFDSASAIITESGNCYVRDSFDGNGKLGLSNPKQYENRYNVFNENSFVEMYSNGDAKQIELSQSGGTIVTNDNKLYLFSSENSNYSVPTLIMSDVLQARLSDDKIFIINTSFEFGYYYLCQTNPSDFVLLKSGIKSFDIALYSTELIALSNDGILYSAFPSGTKTYAFTEVLNGISSVSTSWYDNICALGIVNENGEAFAYRKAYYDNIIDVIESGSANYQNIKEVSVYAFGAVMIDTDDNVIVSGLDITGEKMLDNVTIGHDGKMISSYSKYILVLNNSGTFNFYGYLPSKQHNSFAE